MQGINKDSMAYYNRMLALNIIYKQKKISKKELALALNLSIPSITNIIKYLEDKNYLTSTGELLQSHGQHKGYWSINPEKDYFLCLSVSPSTINVVIVDACINIVTPLKTYQVDYKTIQELTLGLIKTIKKYIKKYPYITKISVACHGIVDYEKGISILMPRLQQKTIYPIQEKIAEQISLPIKIDNSCNIYALAEKWMGSGNSVNDFVWINLAQGVGAAIVFDKAIYRGQYYTAGEIGHIEILENGPSCQCGNKGCLEMLIGCHYIQQQWASVHSSQCSLESFFQHVHKNNQEALQIMNNIVKYLAKGILSIIHVINPQKIFLGGILTKLGEPFVIQLQDLLNKNSMYQLHQQQEIQLSTLTTVDLVSGGAFLWIEEELSSSTVNNKRR